MGKKLWTNISPISGRKIAPLSIEDRERERERERDHCDKTEEIRYRRGVGGRGGGRFENRTGRRGACHVTESAFAEGAYFKLAP